MTCVITYKADFYSARTADSFQTADVTCAAPVSINTQNTPQEARPQWLKFPEIVSQLVNLNNKIKQSLTT
jgi:hypothetical protein